MLPPQAPSLAFTPTTSRSPGASTVGGESLSAMVSVATVLVPSVSPALMPMMLKVTVSFGSMARSSSRMALKLAVVAPAAMFTTKVAGPPGTVT